MYFNYLLFILLVRHCFYLEMAFDDIPTCDKGKENFAAAFIVLFSSLAGTLGNGLVIASYYYSSYLREQPGNCFIMNLALTDFLISVYVQGPAIITLANPDLHLEKVACAVHGIFVWSILTASNWLVAGISVDRVIAINRPFKYPNIVTKARVRYVYFFLLYI